MKVSDLDCGTCFRCCTTNEDKRFRTPILKSDWKDLDFKANVSRLSPNGNSIETTILQAYGEGKAKEVIADDQSQGLLMFEGKKVIPDYQDAHTESKAFGCKECKWLAGNGKCSVYEKRPFICKQYPFQYVKVNGQIKKSIVINNCHLGTTIFSEICSGNQEFIDYANKVFQESMDTMTFEEAESMADYAEDNYKGFAILNI